MDNVMFCLYLVLLAYIVLFSTLMYHVCNLWKHLGVKHWKLGGGQREFLKWIQDSPDQYPMPVDTDQLIQIGIGINNANFIGIHWYWSVLIGIGCC